MYNGEFKEIDTREKAYLLGLFYSDGNCSENQSFSRINLKKEDEDILLKIKENFPFFKIYRENRRTTLQNNFKQFNIDLKNKGCISAKSTRNKDIFEYPYYLENDLQKHFIRGYFDGDGGCSVVFYRKKWLKRIYIYSNSIKLLEGIVIFLNHCNIKTTINKHPVPRKSGFSKIDTVVYKLDISTCSYNNFYKLLYEDSNLFLNRKREKFNEILKLPIFIKSNNLPNCIKCNSINTVKNGLYKKTQRLLCKDCKITFNLTAPNISNNISGEDELLES